MNRRLLSPYDPLTGVYQHERLGTSFEGPLRQFTDMPHFVTPQILPKDSLNLVLTRNAEFDWSWNRTAAGAETFRVLIPIDHLTFDQRQPLEVWIAYQVGVVALTSLTPVVKSTVFANGVAPSIAATVTPGGDTLTLTAAATPYLKRITVPPTVLGPNLGAFVVFNMELTIVMANTGTFRLYGVFFRQPT